jgi:hypothetical protein
VQLVIAVLLTLASVLLPMALSVLAVGSASVTLGCIGGVLVGVPTLLASGAVRYWRHASIFPIYISVLGFVCCISLFIPFVFPLIAVTALFVGTLAALHIRRELRRAPLPRS